MADGSNGVRSHGHYSVQNQSGTLYVAIPSDIVDREGLEPGDTVEPVSDPELGLVAFNLEAATGDDRSPDRPRRK